MLDILREEIEITMAKCGRPTIASIDSTVIVEGTAAVNQAIQSKFDDRRISPHPNQWTI